jgi:GR25 family glycosyltransferase involved in LPS biosynthesis
MFSILNYHLADCGFYINLDSSTDRKNDIEQQINKFNIQNLNRFPASTDELIQSSCTNSHRSVFHHCLDNGFKSAFVAEDDFEILENPIYLDNLSIPINDFLIKNQDFILNGDYDVIQFGCNPKRPLIIINDSFAYNYSSTGAWAYIIKEKAMKYVLDNYNYRRDYQAIDDILPLLNNVKFKTLVTIPQIIKHKDGICSTLQPHVGATYYSTWISGNWHKHLYEKYDLISSLSVDDLTNKLNQSKPLSQKLTVVIVGHCLDNWIKYLKYLFKSMPKELLDCRFIISYDSCSGGDEFSMYAYFRDHKPNICPHIEFVNHGLPSSVKKILSLVNTEYCLFLEHDWVFLNKDIDFTKLINVFNKYDFINAVWFNKDDNQMRGFEIAEDKNNFVTPFVVDSRIQELPLISCCRWSNNPAIFRVNKFQYWFDKYINNDHIDSVHHGVHGVEETMISEYRKEISNNDWNNIKDDWGTYLYGNINDGPYVGHTDASQRYQDHNKSPPEYNGEKYMLDNPLLDTD